MPRRSFVVLGWGAAPPDFFYLSLRHGEAVTPPSQREALKGRLAEGGGGVPRPGAGHFWPQPQK